MILFLIQVWYLWEKLDAYHQGVKGLNNGAKKVHIQRLRSKSPETGSELSVWLANLKVCTWPWWPTLPELILVSQHKATRGITSSPRWDASPLQGYPQHFIKLPDNSLVLICTPGWKETLWEWNALSQEQNTLIWSGLKWFRRMLFTFNILKNVSIGWIFKSVNTLLGVNV